MIIVRNCNLLVDNSNNEKFKILNDINLNFKKGEKVSIFGNNGAGKSTLLKVISKRVVPSSGEIINDYKTSFLSYGDNFNPQLSGLENIYMALLMNNIPIKMINENIKKITSYIGGGNILLEPFYKYPRGIKTRIRFVTSMFIPTEVLLVDEALRGGVDKNFQKIAAKLLKNYVKDKTFILVSHNLGDILEFTDKFVCMQDGKITNITDNKKDVEDYFKKN